jgi:hypothetical protein
LTSGGPRASLKAGEHGGGLFHIVHLEIAGLLLLVGDDNERRLRLLFVRAETRARAG